MKYTEEEVMRHRKIWTDALRSGKYQQGKCYLCKEGKYCCLGVACEVYIEAGNSLPKEVREEGIVYYDKLNGSLPWSVCEWLNMKRQGMYFDNTVRSLIHANDTLNFDFNKIADIIENKEFEPIL